MSFPTGLTDAVDGVTEIIAAHLNNLEAKVGIDSSAVATSLDYLLKNAGSVDPGHKHTKLWKSDGSAEAVTVDSSGNVGIGTANPIYSLDVNGGGIRVAGATNSAILASVSESSGQRASFTSSNDVGSYVQIEMRGSTVSGTLFGISNANLAYLRVSGANNFVLGTGNASPLIFGTNNAERMRIDNSGNVGIGATSFGTSASKVLGLGSGTAPSTSPADMFQLYAADQTAGNACPFFRTENGAIIKLYQQAHLADPAADLATLATWAAAINLRLENLGLHATS